MKLLLNQMYIFYINDIQVGYVNFTWMSGNKNYFYMFDTLDSDDKNILEPPTVTVKTDGKIPKRPKGKINVLKVTYYIISKSPIVKL